MRRRDILIGAAASLTALPARAGETALHLAARQAYIFTLPLVEIAQVRAAFFARGARAQHLYGRSTLATPQSRGVTTPNNDTFTASGFIDLSHGPALLYFPPLHGRYASLALMDMYSNNFQILSPRTIGDRSGIFRLVGPNAPDAERVIRSPTPWVWALARVLVDGPKDVDAAAAVLKDIQLDGSPAGPSAGGAARAGPWRDYLIAAHRLIRENPPRPTDSAILAQMAPLGLGSDAFDLDRFKGAEADEIAAGVEAARAELAGGDLGGGLVRGGWAYEAPGTGNFGQDYVTRARVAIGGLAALPAYEALYLSARDPAGHRRFTGDGPWRIRFAPGQTPPADAFWSLTMYEALPDGHLFLTSNPIGRYSIGNRTQGLARDADGGLTVWISRTDPGAERRANWLPAPATGPFALILRAYLPRPEMLSLTYVPPPVIRA